MPCSTIRLADMPVELKFMDLSLLSWEKSRSLMKIKFHEESQPIEHSSQGVALFGESSCKKFGCSNPQIRFGGAVFFMWRRNKWVKNKRPVCSRLMPRRWGSRTAINNQYDPIWNKMRRIIYTFKYPFSIQVLLLPSSAVTPF